jgi:hypothetical protein
MLILAAFFAFATPNLIGPKPAQLVESCKEVRFVQGLTQNSQVCIAFISGVVDGQQYLAPEKFPGCFPHTSTISDLATAVVKYGEAHPQVESSVALVTNAIKQEFPCPAK